MRNMFFLKVIHIKFYSLYVSHCPPVRPSSPSAWNLLLIRLFDLRCTWPWWQFQIKIFTKYVLYVNQNNCYLYTHVSLLIIFWSEGHWILWRSLSRNNTEELEDTDTKTVPVLYENRNIILIWNINFNPSCSFSERESGREIRINLLPQTRFWSERSI